MSTLDDVERRVVEVLDAIGIPYEIIPIDPQYADTATFCEHYQMPLDRAANTLIIAAKRDPKQFAACVVLATNRLDANHSVKKLMGNARLSFATSDETKALTGMMLGGVTVFALPPDLPIYVDEKVMAPEWVILGSGSRSSKVKVAPEVLCHLPSATIVPGLSVGS